MSDESPFGRPEVSGGYPLDREEERAVREARARLRGDVDADDVVIPSVSGEGIDVLLVIGSDGRRRVWRLDKDGVWVRTSDVVVERAWPLELVFWLLLLAWLVVLAFGSHDAAVGLGVLALTVGLARWWRDRA